MENIQQVDLIVRGADIVTMDAERTVLTGADVRIRDGMILAITRTDQAPTRGGDTAALDATILDATGCVVVPGYVNAHQHLTATPLTRSLVPERVSGAESIFEWAVPTHAAVDERDDEVAASLAAVECLLRGVTTVLEAGTVAHPEAVARALRRVGIRGRLGRWGSDSPGMPGTAPAVEILAAQEETVHAIGRDEADLVRGWVTLVGHSLATDELFTGALELATALECGATWHLSPSEDDVVAYAARSGLRPVEHLHRIGALGPNLLLGHALWIDERELDLLVETGTAVVACPAAYLRLGQGLQRASRYPQFVRGGGRLALGSDAHNAGDAIDLMRAAWLLSALDRDGGGPDPLRADETFALATCAGAAAAGLPDVGSVQVGQRADLVVLDGTDPRWVPRGDPAMQLVWGDGGNAVRDVVVAGVVVVRHRCVLTVDVGQLRAEAAERATALRWRAGLRPLPRWPVRPAGLSTEPHVIGGPAAWRGPQLRAGDDWKVELDAAQRVELLAALDVARAVGRDTGKGLREMTVADFPLSTLAPVLAAALDDVIEGRGFVLLRGIPIEDLADDSVELLYWGIGLHIGIPIHQKSEDDLLVHITDQGVDPNDPLTRGFQTSTSLDYHCDSSDIVGLLCVRPAKSGGVSTIVSSVAVHDELVRRAPDAARLLREPWWHDRKSSDDASSFFRCSVFGERDGRLFAHYGRSYMESASRFADIPELTQERVAALDALDALLNSEEFVLNMDFRPGDIQLLNNYTVMHARTSYQDHPEPERRRDLIRLWLIVDRDLGLPEDFAAAGIVSRDVAFR